MTEWGKKKILWEVLKTCSFQAQDVFFLSFHLFLGRAIFCPPPSPPRVLYWKSTFSRQDCSFRSRWYGSVLTEFTHLKFLLLLNFRREPCAQNSWNHTPPLPRFPHLAPLFWPVLFLWFHTLRQQDSHKSTHTPLSEQTETENVSARVREKYTLRIKKKSESEKWKHRIAGIHKIGL